MSHYHGLAWRNIRVAAAANSTWINGTARLITYDHLRDRTAQVAGFASSRGMKIGDRVILATADDAEAALLFAALVLNGLTAVTIDPEAGPERARALISQAQPSLILVDRLLIDRWKLKDDERL